MPELPSVIFMTGRGRKAVSGAHLAGEVLALNERKSMVGGSLGCLPWLCFVLQLGKNVVGLSHKKIILKCLEYLVRSEP